METLSLVLLCILDIVCCTVFTIIIPHKIQSNIKATIIIVAGVCLSIALLFPVAVLGKMFNMLEEAKMFILITFALNSSMDTVYLFSKRNHWI